MWKWRWHWASFSLSYVTLCYPILPFFPSLFKTYKGDSFLWLNLSDSLTAPAACLLMYNRTGYCFIPSFPFAVCFIASPFFFCLCWMLMFFSLASLVSISQFSVFSICLPVISHHFLWLWAPVVHPFHFCERNISGNIHLIGHRDLTKEIFGHNSRIHRLIMAKFHKHI